MYKTVVRPILFMLPPEFIHHMMVNLLRIGCMLPGVKTLIGRFYDFKDPALETELFGLKFPNRVGLAAGFDKKANVYNEMAALGFGHIEIGTVNPLPQPGNPRPRLFRLPKDKALINRMGFNNPGVETFVKNLRKRRPEVIIGGNIGKNTATPNEKAIDDYLACFTKLLDLVDYFVINVSCPNIEGLGKLQDKDELIHIVEKLNGANYTGSQRKPVLLKIAPDLTEGQLNDTIDLVKKTGIDGIIATNTTTRRDQLISNRDEVHQIGKGGLSGNPLRSQSTETIRYIVKKTEGKIPVIGVGGIMSEEDALEKIKAGASLVQVYTGFVYEGPGLVKRINKKLSSFLQSGQ